MKYLKIVFAICIACIACEKKTFELPIQLNSIFTLDSTRSDKNNISSDVDIVFNNTTSSAVDMPNGIGKVGSCISLLGSTTVSCNNNLFKNNSLQYGKLQYFSCSFWFKVNDMYGLEAKKLFQSIATGGTTADEDFYMKLKNDSLILEHTDYSVLPNKFHRNSIALNTYLWSNIIITYDENYNVYLNGNLTYTIKRNIEEQQNLRYLIFGNDYINVGLYMYLDEINVWNYPINSTEVINYYNATK